MNKKLNKMLVLVALLIGASMFIFPLFWMMSTALKPLEQTMSIPPTWLPYQSYWQQEGEQLPVKLGQIIDRDMVVLAAEEGAPERLVDATDAASEEGSVVRTIAGSVETPWVQLLVEGDAKTNWQYAPASEISKGVKFRWENFGAAIEAMKFFPSYLKNTIYLCVLTVLGTVFSSALAAYGFAKIEWKGRDKIFVLALATMMIPFPVTMVPLYSLFRDLGWIGSFKPLWVGSFFAGAFNVFLLRQFFMSIPKDLLEAARIDGCGEFRIFWQVVLPLSKPALMVVGLFQFMATWNDFLGPLIYLTEQDSYTLALGLQFFQSQKGGTEWHYLMAASTMVVLPVIILFFFTQKTFIEGINMTGIK